MQKYLLSKKLAAGGMAEVYLGKRLGEQGFQQLCAIKKILPKFSKNNEFIKMFRDEAHVNMHLQHANIVKVEGFEEFEGSYGLVMEYVHGVDLRCLISALQKKGEKLPVEVAVYIAAESARGLSYAHEKQNSLNGKPLGVIHRDISPHNILLSLEGDVKVTDFGIAHSESRLNETTVGIIKGKYAYMSPEQILGDTVDVRTDIFALAVVLWEMLAMKPLFCGKTRVQTVQLVRECKISSILQQINQSIPKDIEIIVRKALEKEADKRFQKMNLFEEALRQKLSQYFQEFHREKLKNLISEKLSEKIFEKEQNVKEVFKDQTKLSIKVGSAAYDLRTEDTANTLYNQKKIFYGLLGGGGFLFLIIFLRFLPSVFKSEIFQVQIISKPARVKLKMGNKYLFNGRYIRSPIKVQVPEGNQTLILWRQGYYAKRIRVFGETGDKIFIHNISLKPRKNLPSLQVQVYPKNMLAPVMNLNRGELLRRLPSVIHHVVPHKIHHAKIIVSSKNMGDNFNCRFKVDNRYKNQKLFIFLLKKNCKIIL